MKECSLLMRYAQRLAVLAVQVAALSAQTGPSLASPPIVQKYLKLPLAFERHGAGAEEKFIARGQGYAVGLSQGKATIALVSDADKSTHVASLEFAGARAAVAIPGRELPGKVNYIQGNQPAKWQTGLSTWENVRYADIYPGIDVVYYGNQQQLEFDLVVKPGADPEAIRLKVSGSKKLSIDATGALAIDIGASSDLRIELPKIYQEVGKTRKSISGRYSIRGNQEVAFSLDRYDRTRQLMIDPTITYSTVLGGGLASSYGYGIAVDSGGNIIVAGYTYSSDFPTANAFQSAFKGSSDGFISKINPAGTALIYSTYIGGSNFDFFQGLAVDSNGSAWAAGYTSSTDFPTLNPTQANNAGNYDAVVVKLNASGALQFSTYLGGSSYEYGYAIAVDPSGNAYVTGYTQGPFPVTTGPISSGATAKAFVSKFGTSGSLVYSTLLGGSGIDSGNGIAADGNGNAYVTGYSYSSAFIGAPSGGAQPGNNGGGDAYVAKLIPNGSALSYFTFLGGAGLEQGRAIAVDSGGNAYVAGQTTSSGFATAGAAQTSEAGATDGFVAKLNPAGSAFLYITYLGGSRQDYMSGLAPDGSGNVYVAGYTESVDFPVTSGVQQAFPGNGTSLFQSTNSAASWSGFDANIPGAVLDISVDPANSAIIVAATDAGIYRTVNGGASWTSQYAAAVSSTPPFLARSPVATGTIYAVLCCSVVYKSTDDGATWNLVGTVTGQARGILADPVLANTVYMFGYNAPYVYVSNNGGATWSSAAAGLPGTSVYTMTATTDGAIYAGTTGSGIYKSTNQGTTWTAVNTGLPPNAYAYQHSLTASGTTVYFSSGTVYVTTNGGTNWTALPNPIGAASVAASPQNPSILYSMTSAGTVQVSTNGGSSWNAAGTGLPSSLSSSTSELVVDPTNAARAFIVAPVNSTAFVVKLNSAGSALIWSTYLGGSAYTAAYAVAANSNTVFVTGYTGGQGFPLTSAALPSSNVGAFVTEISDATAPCTVSASPGSATLSGVSQTLTFSVLAPSGCGWGASSNQGWAAITAGASGSGTGDITVQVGANSTGSTRSANLAVGSQNITLTQASSSCGYSLDQTSYTAASAGGAITAYLTAGAGCPWTVTNNYPSAIAITSGASGTGSGAITLSVTPNMTAATRIFVLSVGTTQIQISQSGALQLITLTPCRVMDTRNPTGPLGGPYIAASTVRSIPVPSSACGVPSNAVAYSLNITVVPRTGTLSYLTVWPAGQAQPLVSTLNSLDGSVLANAAIVPAGTGGAINAFATQDTELVIDINGYFVPPSAGTLQFYPLTPCRILDTRNPNGTFGGPTIAGGTSRSFLVPSSACGVPASASAYSLNVTVVPKGPLGYLTTWPTGQSQPYVSTLNSGDGTILANAAIVPGGTGGAVSFYASNTTDVVADINGYFAPPGTGGLNFYTVNPCRLVDTRNAAGPLGGPILNGGTTRTFPLLTGSCGLPSNTQAYSLNMTVVPSGVLGFLTTWPAGGSQPLVSTLNALKGQVVANAAIIPAGTSGSINAYVTNTTHVIIDTNGYFGQ